MLFRSPRTRTWNRAPSPLARWACIGEQLPWSAKDWLDPVVHVHPACASIWLAARPHMPHAVNTTFTGSARFETVAGHARCV